MSGHGEPRLLIADDEPLLREHLAALLRRLWPQAVVVAQARHGREAVELCEAQAPHVAFLDVQMPGVDGVQAARAIGRRALVVFVTAHEQYAVQAFEQGAIDYVVKPFDEPRLADTVRRLRERLAARTAAAPAALPDLVPPAASPEDEADAARDDLLRALASRLAAGGAARPWLQWIRASVGSALRLIPVDKVAYLRSDEKYTLVAWEGGEALIRKPIRELADELDPERFVQIHRSVIVNLHHVRELVRGTNDTADLHLHGRSETLPVSRSYLHRFRQM